MRFAIVGFMIFVARVGRAQPIVNRTPMPEPIVGESITDVDSTEPGELEVSVVGATLGRASGGATPWLSLIEAEARANARLGLAAEVGATGLAGDASAPPPTANVAFSASYVLLHDFRRELHLQAIGSARIPVDENGTDQETFEPEVLGLPFIVGLHAAWRTGRFNLRGTLAGGYGAPLTVPLAGNVAALVDGGTERTRWFVALELNADGSRAAPFMVVPEASLGSRRGDVGWRIGVAVPLVIGYSRTALSAGGLLRVQLELDTADDDRHD